MEEGEKTLRLITGILERIEEVILGESSSYLPKFSDKRLPNSVNFFIKYFIKYIEGEPLVLSLDMQGITCSAGSVCSFQSFESFHKRFSGV